MTLSETLSAACGAPVDVYLTEGARGAVVICPGGGYEWRSPREAEPVARRFNTIGLLAFVLQYDCSSAPLGDRPLHTLSRAVAAVRTHCPDLPSGRVAVCGFSAGGHLAASLGVRWHDPSRFPAGTDLAAHRPDLMILGYPVVTAGAYAHRGSFVNLAGPDPDAQALWSLETLVTPSAPPAFVWHTADDKSVPCQNSLLLVGALAAQGVSTEFHLYPHGVHGLSLATPEVDEPEKGRLADPHVAGWFDELTDWLNGFWPAPHVSK